MGSSSNNPFNGSSWNPFEGVSIQKPFGESALGQGLGQEQKNIGQAFTDVSLQKPYGNSSLGQLGGYLQNQTGFKGLQNSIGMIPYVDFNPSQKRGRSETPSAVQIPGAPSVVPLSSTYNGSQPSYMNNTSEQNFLDSYAKSLNPNVNYNINAQTSPFNSAAVKGATPVSTGGK